MQYRNIDKQALKENGYTVLSKITIVGINTVFTEDDHIVNWTYEDYRYVPDNGFIGQFVERIFDGNLQDISEDVILEDTEINLQLGIVNGLDNNTTTWYNYGNFLVTKVEKTDTTGEYKFESADYTKKFNKVFDGDYTDTTYTKSFNERLNDEETVTALWLAQYVCAQAGVVLNDTNFTNYNFVISSNQYDSGDTLRKVMQDIGKLAYSWVRVGEDNKVHIDFTPKATSSVDQYDRLTTDEYYVSKKSDLTFGPVNKVLIGMSDVEGENLYVTSPDYTEETECAIKIYDNNLTNTEELRQIALNGASRLFGLTYTPVEINSVGHPWLNGDELIKLTNVDDVELYTYPFNRKLTYSGYIEGTIGAEAQTSQQSKYEYKSDIISDVRKTSFIVDKQEQTITGLVENMNDIILETTVKKTEEGNPIEIYDAGSYSVEDFKIYGNAVQDGTPSVQNPVEIETLTSKEENENYSGTNIEFYNDTDNYSIENNYVLEGDTSQNGTPTPSSPIPVNVVSGDNTINICGKNLFNLTNIQNNRTGRTSFIVNDNDIMMTATTGGTYRYIYKQIDNLTIGQPYIIKINSYNDTSTNKLAQWGITTTGGSYYGNIQTLSNTQSLTITPTETSIQFRIGYLTNSCSANDTLTIGNIQLEKGNQATTYEPYIGHSYYITLPSGIELCKIGTYQDYFYKGEGYNLLPNNATTRTINGVTFKVNSDKSVTLNGTASAIADLYTFGSSTDTGNYLYIPKGTYSISTPSSGWFYIGREKTLGAVVGNSALLNALSSQDCYFYGFIIRATSGSSFSNLTLFPVINKGSTALPYEPYGSKDKWLLHKEIGKVVLNGSESGWGTSGTNVSGKNRFANSILNSLILKPSSTSEIAQVLSDLFVPKSAVNTYGRINGISFNASGTMYIYYDAIETYNVNDFKTWLSTHNTIVYYVLANPTTEEITNEELINQLNSIELLNGLNNIIITSSNLPGILNINQTKYPYQIIRIKDNIGIYNDYKLILKDVEYARVIDNRDYIYPENDKWYSYKIINKINSYNGETIDTDYISTTGELSTGATVYYVADEPNIQEIADENILTPLNDLKNTLLYNGYNKIELLNELVDKLSITYLTDSELNASYATKSELQITANNITSTVSETTTKVNELDEKIEEVNASISEQTSTSITDWFNTSLKSLIEDLETSTNNNSNEIINIQSYIRRGRITDVTSPYYNQAYIELGDSTNQTTLRILQNRIQFLTNGEETAYISNNQLYINESTILTKEKIGHWVTTEDEDGLLNTYWEE